MGPLSLCYKEPVVSHKDEDQPKHYCLSSAGSATPRFGPPGVTLIATMRHQAGLLDWLERSLRLWPFSTLSRMPDAKRLDGVAGEIYFSDPLPTMRMISSFCDAGYLIPRTPHPDHAVVSRQFFSVRSATTSVSAADSERTSLTSGHVA
jgi:hypothetical protein